jgi:3-methylfumaryl-CoA hydratase
MTPSSFEAWVGRQQVCGDQVTAAPLRRLAALLDHGSPPWRENELPPLGHWLFHLTDARQSMLGPDGHLRNGDAFLPPTSLRRRLWLGSRVRFLHRVAIGAETTRRSTITNIGTKTRTTGEMLLVTVRHAIICTNQIAIEEEQDIGYLGEQTGSSEERLSTPAAMPDAQVTRIVQATPELLFRFSALTFNAHRIHYDRQYALNTEHYPGLVVQGPLLATLLVDLFLRHRPAVAVTRFSVRALAPVFDSDSLALCLSLTPAGGDLWVLGSDGQRKMTAQIVTDSLVAP